MMRKLLILIFITIFISGYAAPYVLAEVPVESDKAQKESLVVNPQETSASEKENNPDSIQIAMDTGWVLLAGVLVMFMQAGFAMLTAGFSRSKNACNMLMKNLMDFCFGTVAYWAIGFGLMFGAGNLLFGTSGFFLRDTGNTFASLDWSIVPLECKYFFQLVFCATAATIVAGSMAERTKFAAYIFYSIPSPPSFIL